jgi:two-component system, NarL family, response regulator EvgA
VSGQHAQARATGAEPAIAVAIVEDHPPTRAGLKALLASVAGIELVADAPATRAAWPLVRRTRPDVAIVGCATGWVPGLAFCAAVAREPGAPRVLAAAPAAPARFAVAAVLAGASGAVPTRGELAEVQLAARLVARGIPAVPPIGLEELTECGRRLDADDLPILGMALAGTPYEEIAGVLSLRRRALDRRVGRMIAALCDAE